MSKPHDEFTDAFDKFMERTSVADAMSVVTGMFVSLLVNYLDAMGEDSSKEIKINGGDKRDITIHAAKDCAAAKEQS